MSYFVYYNGGSCSMGNHVCGLEEFDTLAKAEARIKELKNSGFSITIMIIEGNHGKMPTGWGD
jgi:hypothetical protein